MGFIACVLADSVGPDGLRITTFEATYPRIVHSEQMTHRTQSRNSASTRAIPLASHLHNLLVNPFIPEKFGINQPGMQASQNLVGLKHDLAVEIWLSGRDRALTTVLELILGRETTGELLAYKPNREFVAGEILLEKFDEIKALLPKSADRIDLRETTLLNVHKQLAGRGLEAYMWHTIITTATEWSNYFALRDHAEAQGEIATIARLIRAAYEASEPTQLNYGEWHLPLVDEDEFEDDFDAIRASAARTAAVSYNRQSARNPEKEFERYTQLRDGGHMSPLEHQARPFSKNEWAVRRHAQADARVMAKASEVSELSLSQIIEGLNFNGNLRGWHAHRKDVPFEDSFADVRKG